MAGEHTLTRPKLTVTPPNQCPYKVSLSSINFQHITVSEIWPRQDLIRQGHYGKVKSMSHHYVAHLQTPINAPSINFLHLTVSDLLNRDDVKGAITQLCNLQLHLAPFLK